MGNTSEELKQKLSRQIDAGKERLETLKRDVQQIHAEDMATLSQRQSEIRARLDQRKLQAEQLKEKITSWKNEKVSQTRDTVASWKEQRATDKLQRRAERAEDHAVDMVTIAASDFDEAEQAVFEAIAARLEADQASA